MIVKGLKGQFNVCLFQDGEPFPQSSLLCYPHIHGSCFHDSLAIILCNCSKLLLLMKHGNNRWTFDVLAPSSHLKC